MAGPNGNPIAIIPFCEQNYPLKAKCTFLRKVITVLLIHLL